MNLYHIVIGLNILY